jgi:hypothetical protein
MGSGSLSPARGALASAGTVLGLAFAIVIAPFVEACGGDGPPPDPDCVALPICRDEGRCSPVDGVCLAVTDADCIELSDVCTRYGTCTASAGACVATSDADCEASSTCTIYGGCRARGGHCIAITDADCERSSGCELYGWCMANLQGECVKVGE